MFESKIRQCQGKSSAASGCMNTFGVRDHVVWLIFLRVRWIFEEEEEEEK